ncbi:hypothetical protein [Celeribacter sp.]|uniref:hypothetical protein n=1 Tax=Celeribacter sp. TaxID=1890673 RepID=UPI003A901417
MNMHTRATGERQQSPMASTITFIDPDHTQFYVAAQFSGRVFLIAGPYEDPETARSKVEPIRSMALDADQRARDAAFGLASSNCIYDTPFGQK